MKTFLDLCYHRKSNSQKVATDSNNDAKVTKIYRKEISYLTEFIWKDMVVTQAAI